MADTCLAPKCQMNHLNCEVCSIGACAAQCTQAWPMYCWLHMRASAALLLEHSVACATRAICLTGQCSSMRAHVHLINIAAIIKQSAHQSSLSGCNLHSYHCSLMEAHCMQALLYVLFGHCSFASSAARTQLGARMIGSCSSMRLIDAYSQQWAQRSMPPLQTDAHCNH